MKGASGLTTRRLSYAFVLAVGCSWVFFFGGIVTYALFFLSILVPLLSILQLVAVRRRLRLFLSADVSRVGKNQSFSYWIALRNDDRFFPLPALNVEIAETSASGQLTRSALHLRPGEDMTLSLPISYPFRGLYTLPRVSVKGSDMLGLCWLDLSSGDCPPTIAVYPDVHVLRDCRVTFGDQSPASLRVAQTQHGETTTSSDSRLYQYGDPVNRIHWKLTARKDELIVRQFESEEEAAFLFLLDTTPPPPDAFAPEAADRVVECAVAVLHDCLLHHRKTRLLHGRSDGGMHSAFQSDEPSFETLLDHLAIVPFDSHLSLGDLARLVAPEPFAGAVAFTSHYTLETVAALAALCCPGRTVSLVAATTDDQAPTFEVPPYLDVHVIPPGADIAVALGLGASGIS